MKKQKEIIKKERGASSVQQTVRRVFAYGLFKLIRDNAIIRFEILMAEAFDIAMRIDGELAIDEKSYKKTLDFALKNLRYRWITFKYVFLKSVFRLKECEDFDNSLINKK